MIFAIMELFFANPQNISNTEITLDAFERKHVVQSLRKSPGEKLFVTDGQGHLYHAELISERPDVKLKICNKQDKQKNPVTISLAIGFIRPARLDFVFEKCTELGVQNFYLIRTQHCNYSSENIQRYEKITRQAIKQSQQFFLPNIVIFQSIETFIQHTSVYDQRIAAIDAEKIPLFSQLIKIRRESASSFLYIVGPEGGFSNEESTLFQENNFVAVSLGPNRLRAETAAISGISTIQQYIQQ